MVNSKMLSLPGLLMAAGATAQVFDSADRSDDAFSWIQPEDTVVLGQYGHSEPIYPSPRDFVAELTPDEKADMITGKPGPCIGNIYPIPRLNFSGLCLQDGPTSLRTAEFVSVFPAGVNIASSWDKQIMYDKSLTMGRELRAKGAQVSLAPAVGPMGRSPYSGRNWESFSPDPYLSGVAFEKSIHGLQDAGVQATAKHFILNEQEILRLPVLFPNGSLQYEAVSSNADDRTVHELYLWPFANAVRARAATVMCSYERINGSYACQNSKVLNGILKDELSFQGYVMSEWYGAQSGGASIDAGLDMDMPGHILGRTMVNETQVWSTYVGANVTNGISNGTITTERLDDMIVRIMTPYFALHQDEDFPSVDPSIARLNIFTLPDTWHRDWNLTGPTRRDVRDNHGELIRKHGAESTILLKNENSALPLKAPKPIADYGNDAGDTTEVPVNMIPFEFGMLAVGGGSGAAHFTYLVTPLEAIKRRAAGDGALVESWLNNSLTIDSAAQSWAISPAPNDPEVCLVFLKSWARESVDRETLDMDFRGNELVDKVAGFCNNTVVVTHPAGVNVLPWADHPNVTAILAAHYPGQESGNSIVDVLYGEVNPSGHLPYTIAYNASDYQSPITTNVMTTGKDDWQSYFTERLEIDYRYFDAHDIDVRYEFGFGLSYTTFSLSGLAVTPQNDNTTVMSRPENLPIQPGGSPALWKTLYTAEVTVRNTGGVRGAVVPQLYVTFPDGAPKGTPVRQLRGFSKLELAPAERSQVKFELMPRNLSYRDVVSQQWLIPEGEFTLHVNFSSCDLIERVPLTVVGAGAGSSTAP